MPPTPPPSPALRILQATSITLLSTSAGLNAGLSFFLIPRIMESPTHLLIRQFVRAAASAHRVLPAPLAVLPGLLHAYLAYAIPGRARAYALAAALSLSALPWSRAAMAPLDRKMHERIENPDAGPESAHQIADSWATRNLYRSGAALVAGLIGLYAALA